jgi:hypothetical protein
MSMLPLMSIALIALLVSSTTRRRPRRARRYAIVRIRAVTLPLD